MPKDFSRARRVEEQIKRELASLIREEVDTSDLGMVTLTAVDLSPDLALAKVYFTLLGSRLDQKQGTKSLNDASSHLRHCLAKVLTLRSVPRLNFYYDVSIERGNRLESLLNEVVKKDNLSDK